MNYYTLLLIATLAATVVGLGFSISSVAGSLSERQDLDRQAKTSDLLEARRHYVQQVVRTIKLLLLSTTVCFAAFEFPSDPMTRTIMLRTMLIATIILISYSAIHERLANKKIVEEILRERMRTDAEEGHLYRTLVESNPWGVLAVDTDFNVRFMNHSMELLCGWSMDDLRGRHLHMLIPAEDRDAHAGHEREYLTNPRVRHGDEPIRPSLLRRDGSTIDVEISLVPVEDPVLGTYFYASIRDRATLPTEE